MTGATDDEQHIPVEWIAISRWRVDRFLQDGGNQASVEIIVAFVREMPSRFHEIESAWNGGSTMQALGSALGIDSQPQTCRSCD